MMLVVRRAAYLSSLMGREALVRCVVVDSKLLKKTGLLGMEAQRKGNQHISSGGRINPNAVLSCQATKDELSKVR